MGLGQGVLAPLGLMVLVSCSAESAIEIGADGASSPQAEADPALEPVDRRNRRGRLEAAKAAARAKFVAEHAVVFDAHGRVLSWPLEPVELRCSKRLECTVTKSTTRRFRTKEEEMRQQQIRVDRQAEADGRFGNQTEEDVRKARQAKEDRGRCRLYTAWLRHWLRDDAKTKPRFFRALAKHYADFGELHELHRERSLNRRKAGALYRHVALQVHPDKLPKRCGHSQHMLAMMRDILAEADRLKKELLA